jgi:hypothetical protein
MHQATFVSALLLCQFGKRIKIFLSADGKVQDQSACGDQDMQPCLSEPFCKLGLVPTEAGRCKKCGLDEDGSRPCLSAPYCSGYRISVIGGVELESCEACGSEGEPPCLDEDTGKFKKGIPVCKDGLRRTSVEVGDTRVRVDGQDSYCTAAEVPGQCGFVGQESCNGECKGRSTASEDGQNCVDCGGPGQGTCDGPNQEPCDSRLEVVEQDNLAPICLCLEDGCNECATVSLQSGPGGAEEAEPCGELGEPACEVDTGGFNAADGSAVTQKTLQCGKRLIVDEDGVCVEWRSAWKHSLPGG